MLDTAYQKNKVIPQLSELTGLLEDVSKSSPKGRAAIRDEYKPGYGDGYRVLMTLDEALREVRPSNVCEDDDEELSLDADIDENPEDGEMSDAEDDIDMSGATDSGAGEVIDGLYLAPRQRYFMGANQEPKLVIVTRVGEDGVSYLTYPFKREQKLKKGIAVELFRLGSQNWLKSDKAGRDEDLQKSIQNVLKGTSGEEVTPEDYQYSSVQVKYTGSKSGDAEPWKELEQEYGVNVDSVLTNKQTYNLRLTNKELEKLTADIRNKPIDSRSFKIVKITSEEREYLLEATAMFPDPKPYRQEIVNDFEKNAWRERYANAVIYKPRAGEWIGGQKVTYDSAIWTIIDLYNSYNKAGESLATLSNDDFTSIFYNVPTAKLNVVDEKAKEKAVKDAEKEAQKKEKEAKKQTKDEKPTDWQGKKVDGKAVDKTPKLKELKFPESEPTGETQKQKALDEDVCLDVDLIVEEENETNNDEKNPDKELMDFIENDGDLYKNRYKGIIENLKRKKKDNVYDERLASKAFEYLVDEGAKKYYKDNEKKLFGKLYNSDKDMFPRDVRIQVADNLRVLFEKNYKVGSYEEESRFSQVVDGLISDLMLEAKDEVSSMPFTQKEWDLLKKYGHLNDETENQAEFTWDSGANGYKVIIYKRFRPVSKDYVYSSEATMGTSRMDKTRTQESPAFKSEDDLAILEKFLNGLNLNEETATVDLTGIAEKQGVKITDVHPEELMMGIKVEMEHTQDPRLARKIALDHLAEFESYYTNLIQMEKELTAKRRRTEKSEDK
jgi:hypothetical protein